MNIFILDACALIAFLSKEEGFDNLKTLFHSSFEDRIILKINQINLLEVYYDFIKVCDQKYADLAMVDIMELPIEIIYDINYSVFREAGRLKANYRIPLGDAIALAECIVQNATLVTSDRKDIEKVEKAENIKVNWFR